MIPDLDKISNKDSKPKSNPPSYTAWKAHKAILHNRSRRNDTHQLSTRTQALNAKDFEKCSFSYTSQFYLKHLEEQKINRSNYGSFEKALKKY